jgi:hypothetical protein
MNSLRPPKKPKMSKERYLFLEELRTKDPRHNDAIREDYPDEWVDFNRAYRYYKPVTIIIGPGYIGQ